MDPSEDHHEYCVGGFDPDDIVISGISGRFPLCNKIAELRESLYTKKNPITFSDERFEKGAHNVSHSSCCLVTNLDKFDNNFFRIPHSLANKMDPSARVHMEVVYEAIADAGVDALEISGMKIGIFNATTQEDSLRIFSNVSHRTNLDAMRLFTPNRTSYALDFTAKVPRPMKHSFVQCGKYGDLSSFEWVEANVNYVQLRNRKLLHIYYSALNFRDVKLATGNLSCGTAPHFEYGNSVLGMEFCGREDGTGKRFCGFSSGGGMATAIWASPGCCIEVPDTWTMEEASTVPVAYATCYYAFIIRGNLQKGESILIHSATSGIGMAAINIALNMNCEVFATVGNDEKRKYLKEKYPQIKDENIGCSHNTSFKNMVLKRTNGKGVDMVLNSLADDKFHANFELLGENARFLEFGKYNLSLVGQIGLKIFPENISFHAIVLDKLFEESPKNMETMKKIMDLVRGGIKSGVVKPLDRTIFDKKSVEEAFRYMSKGIHVGKVLLKLLLGAEHQDHQTLTPGWVLTLTVSIRLLGLFGFLSYPPFF